MSFHKATGVSLEMIASPWEPAPFYFVLTDKLTSYSHEIRAEGGFFSARVEIAASRREVEVCLEKLGSTILATNEGGEEVWRGFVNIVRANVGTLEIVRGPFMDIGNRISGRGQTPSYNFSSAGITIGGDQYVTSVFNDTDSQTRWGKRRREVSVGTATTTEAEQVVQTYLREHREPALTHSIGIGSSNVTPSVTLECLGFFNVLDYIPTDTAAAGTMNLSAKIEEILGLDPETVFDTARAEIESNTTQVPQYYAADQTALSVIKALVSRGDSNFNRYLWGGYERDIFRYSQIPTEYAYAHHITDERSTITYINNGAIVKPYDIRPGNWVRVSGIDISPFPSGTDGTTLRDDTNALFIEAVSYSAPDRVTLSGGRSDRVGQMIARLGVGPL